MNDESTTITHLSVAMETTEDDTVQNVSEVEQSSSADEIYLRWAVIVIGVVGTAGNALILYALVVSKQHKKHPLIVNQNVLDLFSSFFLIVCYAVRLCDIEYVGTLGYSICVAFVSDIFVWWGLIGSVVNLAIITIDRYMKVVHHIWSKKWLHPKVINFAMAFAWFVGIFSNTVFLFETSGVQDGVCYTWVLYDSHAGRVSSIIWYIVSFYVIIIAIFIFCYGRILITIRRQARVMASHGATTPHTQQSNQIQTNVIKTMILVSAFYTLAWLPLNVYYGFTILDDNLTYGDSYVYAAMFIANLYTCTNPFIYATKFEPVKQILKGMIPCKKSTDDPTSGVATSIPLQPIAPKRY